MSAPDNISKIERLRLRDGGRCWLCDEPMHFKAASESAAAPTKEHLLAQCHGGTDRVENLVLCHRRCNLILKDLPIAKKVKLRDRRRKKLWIASLRSQ